MTALASSLTRVVQEQDHEIVHLSEACAVLPEDGVIRSQPMCNDRYLYVRGQESMCGRAGGGWKQCLGHVPCVAVPVWDQLFSEFRLGEERVLTSQLIK